jgi:ribosomal protein S18 acetylase RimI-like enzyme
MTRVPVMERSESTVTYVEVRRSLIPTTWDHAVRRVELDECESAGRSLAHSFAADALSHYLLDGEDLDTISDEQKWKLHVVLMNTVVTSHILGGCVTTIGPDHDALAVWETPGGDPSGWWTSFRSGILKLYFQLGPEGRARYFKEMLPLLHDTMAEVMCDRSNDCYYLVYIGTKPSARGQGYASKLMKDMMSKADAENRPMYLESSSIANNAYYSKFGFKVKKEISFKRGRVPVKLDIMVREPRTPKPADAMPVLPLAKCGNTKL